MTSEITLMMLGLNFMNMKDCSLKVRATNMLADLKALMCCTIFVRDVVGMAMENVCPILIIGGIANPQFG